MLNDCVCGDIIWWCYCFYDLLSIRNLKDFYFILLYLLFLINCECFSIYSVNMSLIFVKRCFPFSKFHGEWSTGHKVWECNSRVRSLFQLQSHSGLVPFSNVFSWYEDFLFLLLTYHTFDCPAFWYYSCRHIAMALLSFMLKHCFKVIFSVFIVLFFQSLLSIAIMIEN